MREAPLNLIFPYQFEKNSRAPAGARPGAKSLQENSQEVWQVKKLKPE